MLLERIRAFAILIASALAGSSSLAVTSPALVPAKDCTLAGQVRDPGSEDPAAKPAFPPVQLDISVPFAPTPFPGGGFSYLVYELHLQSYQDEPLALRQLEIADASDTAGKTIAVLSGAALYERLRAIGPGKVDGDHALEGGRSAVALICLAFDGAGAVPQSLSHRVRVGDTVAEGPTIGTRHGKLKVLAPPVLGTDWVADNGPSLQSHHRTGLFVVGGRAQLARRLAIDWKQKDAQGSTYSGDARDVRSYYAYDEKVFAVADAVVVSARDGFPDNIPRTAAGFTPAVPITLENVAGNAVVLDLGDGQFAYYAHLKPGSVRVKAGERVKRGQWLGQIGNSGDARWPHLHFQVTAGADILASEGLPFVIDRYRTKAEDGTWQSRTGEYPIGDIAVEFPLDPATPSR